MISNTNLWTYSVVLSVGLGVTLASVVYLKNSRWKKRFNRSANSVPPTRWKHIGKVKDVYIYPLKSGHYIPIQRGYCDVRGLKYEVQDGCLEDRSFVLFNEKEKTFISSKKFNHLLLIQTEYVGGGAFQFSVYNQPSYEKLTIQVADILQTSHTKSFTLYVDEVLEAFDCGDLASDWFAKYLLNQSDRSIRLGLSTNRRRSIGDNYLRKYTTVYDNVNDEDIGVYADMTSYMVLNENSLRDLNKKMSDIGNIVVDGPPPYAEDTWDWVRFNSEVITRQVKPCTRCILTTVHPDTGHKQPDSQPLKMLQMYRAVPDLERRKVENFAPMFGVYMGVHRTGYVNVGDDVYVGCDDE
ncbi:hypothetical protein M8J76_001582 [Diaphorina citri]|nr:hypothetical protein M8J75_009448 [Diaphorina citri]KAI5732441.1 hypothetical protein M8J76_000264 [Diaphorina citri]KAI5732550.1 hypothetical protein M8J76_001582 [Diaphorina citri]